jgi:hypothetical protein
MQTTCVVIMQTTRVVIMQTTRVQQRVSSFFINSLHEAILILMAESLVDCLRNKFVIQTVLLFLIWWFLRLVVSETFCITSGLISSYLLIFLQKVRFPSWEVRGNFSPSFFITADNLPFWHKLSCSSLRSYHSFSVDVHCVCLLLNS